ncbi:MAG: Lrp/AsnC family transcriptional regulator, partial [Proteobacteria bacterium]|nr:Lrp/AsnC family transcriptional regulator [Pseudomonadota bacterium]
LWKTGQLSNQEIGNLIGLSYSMVSRSVKATNDKILSDQGYRRQYQAVSSEFNV